MLTYYGVYTLCSPLVRAAASYIYIIYCTIYYVMPFLSHTLRFRQSDGAFQEKSSDKRRPTFLTGDRRKFKTLTAPLSRRQLVFRLLTISDKRVFWCV